MPAAIAAPAGLPRGRGPWSHAVLSLLQGRPDSAALPEAPAAPGRDTVTDEDVQLALLLAYELHYAGWADVDPAWEWHPGLLSLVRPLEGRFERDLRRLAATTCDAGGERTSDRLFALAEADDAPSLSRFVAGRATLAQAREYLQHRSLVQLKEADAQTWLIPRLRGGPKGVLIEVQADEYGGGDLARMHSRLWARAMRGVGLSDQENAYVDVLPAISLAMVNAQTMFGLHARLAPAGVGFFTMVEMTSSVPMRRYARGFERLGLGTEVTEYFTEHVAADAVHEQLMGRELVDAWVTERPEVADDVVLGARVCLALDGALARHCLDAWKREERSLRAEVAE